MGGCKCTYRNCNVKSDGKTHMFHYPVFEKVRCHQWLINAHKLEFLNLKVSQLKNRVVCQHHFKDECFMNFKKDKLTHDAIPTEIGPYCDSKNYVHNNEDKSRLYSIMVDDIETDYMVESDKRANFSMKYGDFLTNFDIMDVEKTDEKHITYKPNDNNIDILPLLEDNEKDKFISHNGSFAFKLTLPDKGCKKVVNQPMLVVPPYVNSGENNLINSDFVKNDNLIKDDNMSINFPRDSGNTAVKFEPCQKKTSKRPKITILSEKKITNPLAITGKFEPVSPNFVLNVGKTKRNATLNSQTNETKEDISAGLNIQPNETKKELENEDKGPKEEPKKTLEIEISSEPVMEIDNPQPTMSKKQLRDSIVFENPPLVSLNNDAHTKPSKVSVLKPKVPPERVEAINKKRKFNMKLREVIESCLDKLESPDNVISSNPPEEQIKSKELDKPPRRLFSKPVATSNQDFTIAFLESRLKKMENNLLEKIEQNTKKIVELKNTCVKSTVEKKPTIQTRGDEEAHKKQLFQEISKYLSPSSKSLVYEELFINKFALDEANIKAAKRQRRRVI